MIGLGWRGKEFGKAAVIDDNQRIKIIEPGEGEGISHGKRINALATRTGNHPIQKGLPKKWLFADIEVYTYARAIQWLAKRKVDTSLPKVFPDTETVSLRDNL